MAYSVAALEPLNPHMKSTGTTYPAIVLCCCLVMSLAACGQRGPLYLPEPESPAVPTQAESADEENPGSEKEDKDEETPRA
jgi:predicted small lipoprotein YifL